MRLLALGLDRLQESFVKLFGCEAASVVFEFSTAPHGHDVEAYVVALEDRRLVCVELCCTTLVKNDESDLCRYREKLQKCLDGINEASRIVYPKS